MSLTNLVSPFGTPGQDPNDPNALTYDPKKIAQQAQTDPSVRGMFAQMFMDPASRHFVQDSGNVIDAMARPDNPWTPGTPIVAQPTATPGAPGGSDAAATSVPTAAGPPYSATSFGTGTPSAAGTSPYADAHQYAMDNPSAAAIPGRPVAPMDNVHGARKALLMAFLGLNKFGAGLAHQPNSFADEFLGNEFGAENEQRKYDANLPLLKTQAENQAYSTYLGQTSQESGIEHTQAETANLRLNIPLQQQAAQEYDNLLQHWQNRDVPDFGAYAKARLAGMPPAIAGIVQSRLANIYQIPQTGKGYTVNMQDDLPTSINVYGKDYDRNDSALAQLPVGAAAGQDFDRAMAAHQQKITEQRATADNAARISGEAQGRGFTQAATMQQQAAQIATQQKGREAMMPALGDIRGAQRNQQMIEQLASAKDEASQTALADQIAQAFAPAGSKRLSPIAVDQVVNQGSVSQEAGVKLKKWLEGAGPIAPELIPDLVRAAKSLNDAKLKTANDTLEDTYSVYGVKHPQAGPTGRLDTVQTPASVQVKDLQGGIHTFPNQQAADAFKLAAGIK